MSKNSVPVRPTKLPPTYANVLCIILLLSASVGVTLWHLRAPALGTQDDGFYYYQIARNLARGAGSTFDGTNPTNGYQPLWLVLLVPIFWSPRSNMDALGMGIALQGTALACTLILLFSTARLRHGYAASLFGGLLWLVWMAQESFKGLEFSIHTLAISVIGLLYLAWFDAALPVRLEMFLFLGLACSLAFLARLDTLLLTLILAIVIGVRGLRLQYFRWRNWLAFVIPVIMTVLAYALTNLFFFGHVAPVSGIVKMTWSQTLLLADPLFIRYGWLVAKLDNLLWSLQGLPRAFPLYVAIGGLGAMALWLARLLPGVPVEWRGALTGLLGPQTPFVIYSFVSYTILAIVLHRDLTWSPWYYAIQPWLTALLAVAVFDAVWHFRIVRYPFSQPALQVALSGVLLVLLLILGRQLRGIDEDTAHGIRYEPLFEGAEWARTHLAPDAVIGSWNAGTIGYLSERRTVNLDGVVNSYSFFEHARFDLCSYWRTQGITHLVDVFEKGRALAVFPTLPAYASCASSLHLVWSDKRDGVPWSVQAYTLDSP